MARVPIRKIPRELPDARLFLDDIEDIQAAVQSMSAELDPPVPVTFSYDVDGVDTFTSMDDLVQHAGSTTRFSLNVIVGAAASTTTSLLTVSSKFILWSCPRHLSANERALYGLILETVNARTNRYRNVSVALPSYIFSIPLLICLPMYFVKYTPEAHVWTMAVLKLALAAQAVFFLLVLGLFISNRVYFATHVIDKSNAKRKGELGSGLSFSS